jgi:short-subunit dehydrogenase
MSSNHLKPLDQQVIVITGASSGIGLATAEAAAAKGARLVLAARSGDALAEIRDRLTVAGTECRCIECDVTDRASVQRVALEAIDRFGRIDTWVNNAGTSIFGKLKEIPDADSRRLFEINFWGVVNGSLVALPHLKKSKGALINVGSEVSEAAIPLMGMYTATKHAVKGFTDALRIEVQDIDKEQVSVTLIQPTAVDTPFPQHTRNYMPYELKLPSPQIDPEKVAEVILHAATTPIRDKRVGTMPKANVLLSKLAPTTADKLAAKTAREMHYDAPPRHPEGTLFQPSQATGVVGQTHGAKPAEASHHDGHRNGRV